MTCSRILLSVALFASACAKKTADAPAPSSAKTTVAGSAGSAAAAEAPKPSDVTIDPQIAQMVKDIVAKCQVDPDYMSVNCGNSEEFRWINYAAEKKVANAFESLGEIALTDGAKDPKVFAAVAATWNSFSDRDLEKQNATPAAAERVLKMYPKAAKASAFAYAAAIPLLAGKRAELTAVITALPPEQQGASIRAYLNWGGIAAMPDVQSFLKTGASDDVKQAATDAVDAALWQGNSVSDADKTTMCEWSKSVAGDSTLSDRVFRGALESLSRCGGAYIDVALTGVEGRLATGKLTDALAEGLYHLCWAEGVIGAANNGTPQQCAKAFSLIEKGLAIKDNPADGKNSAIFAAEYLGKNSPPLKEKAKALIKKYASDKDVAATAKTALDGLK